MRLKPTSRSPIATSLIALTATLLAGPAFAALAVDSAAAPATTTPIKHVVVIFQENVSFDHYFATYPHAANLKGEPRFTPVHGVGPGVGQRPQRRPARVEPELGRPVPPQPGAELHL